MDNSGLHIEHQCPQCGAPVTLFETDRILACPFCRVRLMIQCDQPLTYALPLPEQARDRGDILFAPYWRFKGVVYTLNESEVGHRILDLTTRAASFQAVPFSLGMRPQALKLTLALTHPWIRSLEVSLGRTEFIRGLRAAERGRDDCLSKPFTYTAAVGDAVNLLLAPYRVKDGRLHDPYTDRPVSDFPADEPISEWARTPAAEAVHFEPAVCPDCGWDLEGATDSHVLLCRNCQSLWEAVGRTFHRFRPQFLPSRDTADLWVPFWRIETTTTGFDLSSYEDFVRLTNVPKVIQPQMASHPFAFWVPAFKVQPRLFVRLAGALTLAQPAYEPMDPPEVSTLYPCTLAAVEGFRSVPVVLGAIAPAKKELLPRIRNGRFAFREKHLIWVPFQTRGMECIQQDLEFSFPQTALKWGRTL